MKRISIRISDELHEKLREKSFLEKKSINKIVEESFVLEFDLPNTGAKKSFRKTSVPEFIKKEPLVPKESSNDLAFEFHPVPKGG